MNKESKVYQDPELRITFRFATREIMEAARARAKAEGRSLTAHLNELCKIDARKLKK